MLWRRWYLRYARCCRVRTLELRLVHDLINFVIVFFVRIGLTVGESFVCVFMPEVVMNGSFDVDSCLN